MHHSQITPFERRPLRAAINTVIKNNGYAGYWLVLSELLLAVMSAARDEQDSVWISLAEKLPSLTLQEYKQARGKELDLEIALKQRE